MALTDVESIVIEPTSNCTLSCAGCTRNYYGIGSPAVSDLLPEYIDNLNWGNPSDIFISGNRGDICDHHDPINLIIKIKEKYPNAIINISTHGFNSKIDWEQLAELNNLIIEFGVDGVDNFTHQQHRQNSDLSVVLDNAKRFIDCGGVAGLGFIQFKHNHTQLDEIKQLAEINKFKYISVKPAVFDIHTPAVPALNSDYSVKHWLEPVAVEIDKNKLAKKIKRTAQLQSITVNKLSRHSEPVMIFHSWNIQCSSMFSRTININANGDVTPCAYFSIPEKWHKICDHYQVDPSSNNIKYHTLVDIMSSEFWKKLDNSLSSGDTLNICATNCNQKCGIGLQDIYTNKTNRMYFK